MNMRSDSPRSAASAVKPRYSSVGRHKAGGATYTPMRLAEFVAAQMVAIANIPECGRLRILDPACGDGALLSALLDALPEDALRRADVVGFDTDVNAVSATETRLRETFPTISLRIEPHDFLEYVLGLDNFGDFLSIEAAEPFDFVIANPPYVRTQILGAKQAQQLAQQFELSGRVDLCFPFLLGISRVLAPNGVAGVIVSNRFMTTKSGQAVRQQLLSRFRLRHVWDLGDTKLFNAAVLPAVLLAQGNGSAETSGTALSSIYETNKTPTGEAPDPLAALAFPNGSIIAVPDSRRFRVLHGTLSNGGNSENVWRVATEITDAWLATVNAHTWAQFSHIGKIRVGVKTTADKVFIRSDWDTMPENERPELLRPLTTRHCARRFRAKLPKEPKQILYPHQSSAAGRTTVDLSQYPKSARYLERYRATLEARTYVIRAGRRWYEIWVPQDPSAWVNPKLVFLDIAERPKFWIDTEGSIVNGECYWLRCEGNANPDLLWLALAVANSTFIEAFYDHRFHNKLYAGRRRFITQYVEHFPLPNPDSELSRSMVTLAKRIYAVIPSGEADTLARDLDGLVWRVFGLPVEEIPRERNL